MLVVKLIANKSQTTAFQLAFDPIDILVLLVIVFPRVSGGNVCKRAAGAKLIQIDGISAAGEKPDPPFILCALGFDCGNAMP